MSKNATSLAKRITSKEGLKLLLVEQLDRMKKTQTAAVKELERLTTATLALQPETVSQVLSSAPHPASQTHHSRHPWLAVSGAGSENKLRTTFLVFPYLL